MATNDMKTRDSGLQDIEFRWVRGENFDPFREEVERLRFVALKASALLRQPEAASRRTPYPGEKTAQHALAIHGNEVIGAARIHVARGPPVPLYHEALVRLLAKADDAVVYPCGVLSGKFVHPGWWRRGVARRLSHMRLDFARRRSVQLLVGGVSVDLYPVWAARGFRVLGEHPAPAFSRLVSFRLIAARPPFDSAHA